MLQFLLSTSLFILLLESFLFALKFKSFYFLGLFEVESHLIWLKCQKVTAEKEISHLKRTKKIKNEKGKKNKIIAKYTLRVRIINVNIKIL